MERITEQESHYQDLDQMSVRNILKSINKEDRSIAKTVYTAIPQLEELIQAVVTNMKKGGRLFYIGAGTSGRLGVLDASECPPTYGVDDNCVIGLIAGGDAAIRKAIENAEDNVQGAWIDLQKFNINKNDVVIGIAASGTTPYVLGGLLKANEMGCITGSIVCNAKSPIAKASIYPIETVTGPEFVTGSTRMKAGTATKMILNMISTTIMIQLGKVQGNRMVNMKLANDKLRQRGIDMLVEETGISAQDASVLLKKYGSVKLALTKLTQEN